MNQWRSVLAGTGGAMVVSVTAAPFYAHSLLPAYHDVMISPFGDLYELAPIVAVVGALLLLRWWPYLLLAAGLCGGLIVIQEVAAGQETSLYPSAMMLLLHEVPYPLALIGTLGCAQSLRERGAPVAGLVGGVAAFAGALAGAVFILQGPSITGWMVGLVVVGTVALLPALWTLGRGDTAAAPAPGWDGARHVVAAGLVTALSIPVSVYGSQLFGLIAPGDNPDRGYLVVGTFTLVCVVLLATLSGGWALAGTLTGAAILVAVAMSLFVSIGSLQDSGPLVWLTAAGGLALGVAVAATRWRVAGAVVLSVAAAVTLVLTRGIVRIQVLTETTPDVRAYPLLVLGVAAVVAVFGAITPALAPSGAVPAVLGPLAGVLAVAGLRILRGLPLSSAGNGDGHFVASAVLALVAAAGVAAIGLAGHLIRKRTVTVSP
ncbi:hypothetical protein [Actinoplanes subglobosus]|uniref:Integral membrane protein n=1 Tax=Actinoplanes subglobosus TaxID=1547892 RepID=A0ABV8JG04_9ACTN